MRPFRPLAALIAMTMLLTACASAKPIGRLDAALPEENRIRLGAVGVASPCLPPEVAYRVPAKGGWAGAGRGAGVAAMGSGEASMDAARSGGGGAEVGAAILLLSPLTALVGTIVGAACAEPAEKVDAAEAVLNEFTLYNDAAVSMNVRRRCSISRRDRWSERTQKKPAST